MLLTAACLPEHGVPRTAKHLSLCKWVQTGGGLCKAGQPAEANSVKGSHLPSPVSSSSWPRALELSLAMDRRCFPSPGRSKGQSRLKTQALITFLFTAIPFERADTSGIEENLVQQSLVLELRPIPHEPPQCGPGPQRSCRDLLVRRQQDAAAALSPAVVTGPAPVQSAGRGEVFSRLLS